MTDYGYDDPTPWAVGEYEASTVLDSTEPQVRGGIVKVVVWTSCASFAVALLAALYRWTIVGVAIESGHERVLIALFAFISGLLVTTKSTSS